MASISSRPQWVNDHRAHVRFVATATTSLLLDRQSEKPFAFSFQRQIVSRGTNNTRHRMTLLWHGMGVDASRALSLNGKEIVVETDHYQECKIEFSNISVWNPFDFVVNSGPGDITMNTMHFVSAIACCITVTSQWAQWCLKPPASRLLTEPFIQAQIKENTSSASLALVRGIHRWPVNSPHKGPVTRKTFPFDDVIMERLITLKPGDVYIP